MKYVTAWKWNFFYINISGLHIMVESVYYARLPNHSMCYYYFSAHFLIVCFVDNGSLRLIIFSLFWLKCRDISSMMHWLTPFPNVMGSLGLIEVMIPGGLYFETGCSLSLNLIKSLMANGASQFGSQFNLSISDQLVIISFRSLMKLWKVWNSTGSQLFQLPWFGGDGGVWWGGYQLLFKITSSS